MKPDGTNRTFIIPTVYNSTPRWNQNGQKIVYGQGYLEYYDFSLGSSYPIETDGIQPLNPAWSPNGIEIVFASGKRPEELYKINLDSRQITRLTNDAFFDAHPSWAPDGSKIVFDSDRDPDFWVPNAANPLGFDKTHDVFTMNADGTNIVNITKTKDYEAFPVWSPDGSHIAFSTFVNGGPSQIYTLNLASKVKTKLTEFKGFCQIISLSWSPDGHSLAFTLQKIGSESIYIINANGSNLHPITDENSQRARNADWTGHNFWSVSPKGKVAIVWARIKSFE